MKQIIGRKEELQVLDSAFKSKSSEFIAIYGRRRIGKTFLIHHYFSSANCIYFHATGIRKGSLKQQLKIFNDTLGNVFYQGASLKLPKNWFDAFEMLTKAIERINKNKKVIIFLDEFPWMVTRRSKLLMALEYYWNHTWSFEGRIKLIICGSSSSWILKNIIHNTGGLYGRVTKRIGLESFTLRETNEFLKSKNIILNPKRIVDLYMVMGGVPFYLDQIPKGQSSAQIIDALFFNKKSTLFNEYNLLLSALFENSGEYDKLLRALAKQRYGVSQAELLTKSKLPLGGGSVDRLKELEDVGFIQSFIPKGHKEKGKFYRLIDEYILFYLHWIEPLLKNAGKTQGIWLNQMAGSSWKAWSGYAFESVCYKHIDLIARELKIEGALAYVWRFIPKKGDGERGVQIDLLFDREDHSITICEIKYSEQPFIVDKAYALELKRKVEIFRKKTHCQKDIFIALISANSIKQNIYSEDLISQVITLEDLF